VSRGGGDSGGTAGGSRMGCLRLFIVILATFTNTGLCHKCYVCAPDSGKLEDITQLKKYFPDTVIPACSQYKPHLKDQYLLECPPTSSSGCLTKYEDYSVTRTCAPVAIDDCKTANSVQYCYCKSEGCNTPSRHLGTSSPRAGKVSEPDRKSLGPSAAGHSPPVFASQFQGEFADDEDVAEGSADWGDFYYDEYNYGEDNYGGIRLEGIGSDDEGGDEDYRNEDVTNPPPFLDLEDGKIEKVENVRGKHKFDREQIIKEKVENVRGKHKFDRDREQIIKEIVNDIELVEEEDREWGRQKVFEENRERTIGSSSRVTSSSSWLLLLLLLLFSSSRSWDRRSL